MRRIFYLSLLLIVINSISFAQTPGGVGSAVLWLRADDGAATPGNWSDKSGNAYDFSQGAAGNQPALASNVFNFYPALAFDGTKFLSRASSPSFPLGSTDRSIFVVANATNTSGFRWIFVYGNVGGFGQTYQVGNNSTGPTAGLSTAVYGNDVSFDGYWNSPNNSAIAMPASIAASGVISHYDRGTLLQTQSLGFNTNNTSATIGDLNGGLLEAWSGNIAEIIMFPSAVSATDRNKVESYLALKYGTTLGNTTAPQNYTASDGATVFWTASPTFQNDVFGIGTDNGSGLVQNLSNSMNSGAGDGSGQSGKGNLSLGVSTNLTDLQFLMIGNDAGALTEQLIAAGEAPAAAVGSQRVTRNWKVQNTGGVGVIDLLSFDVTGLTLTGGATASNYRLMIDDDGDGDYNTGTQTFVTPSNFNGNKLTFTNVTLPNNVVFTIITQGSTVLLPALWKDFNVNLQNTAAVLTWTTSDEADVDYYTVEYSTNGTSYTSLGNIPAKNNGGINTYTFAQENLPAGARYYRIRRVDKNRNYALSQTLKVQVGGTLSKLSLNTNPITRERVEFYVNATQNDNIIIRIIDASGRILVQQNKGVRIGTNAISTNLPNILPGMYFLQVRLANETHTKKFIKQ